MNHEILEYIIQNADERIEELAKETNLDSNAAIGIAKFLLKNEESMLSSKQHYYYLNCILPLLNNVPCEGIFGDDTCTGNDYVDEESLLISYMEDNFLCQWCRYDLEKNT